LAPFPAYWRVGCQGFAEPNLFTLLNKNQTPFLWKEYLICGDKGKKDFLKMQNNFFFTSVLTPSTPQKGE
jgi:hypothetical protein